MDVSECTGDLEDVVRCFPLLKSAKRLSVQFVVQFSVRAELQNETHAILVLEKSIQRHYVWMVQVGLDFDFSQQLLFDSAPLNLPFKQNFQRN